MKDFTENTRVQVPAALHLCKLGYTYLDNIKDYDHQTNILTDVFLRSIKRLNPNLVDNEIQQILAKIIVAAGNDDLGRAFYQMLSANSGIKLIDYTHPENNEWQHTTEFSCIEEESGDNFRPDITCFINGLPIAFIEVKKPNNHDGIIAERNRINYRFSKKQFRKFVNITQIMIFSNNQEYDNDNRVPIQGAFYCTTATDKAFFNVFREQNPDFIEDFPYLSLSADVEKKILKHRNCPSIVHLPEYQTNKSAATPTNRILTSMLSQERILFLLRYGFAYVNKETENEQGEKSYRLEKHIMRYQQIFASLAIRRQLTAGQKSGIIWHTQGSGKTALAYYSVKSLTDYFAHKNIAAKFYFIVDRIALMEQAMDEFVARGLVVRVASNREDLMKDFRDTAPIANAAGKPEIMVVNIQKFAEDKKKVVLDAGYSTNLQRVFFIDEAHRGYNPEGSFLANLLSADKDAIKIALTGTPLLKAERESWRVFGDYIDTYYYDKSIADGYTLKLMREPIETIYKERLNEILEQLAGQVEVRSSDIDRDKIIEHKKYLTELIEYILTDFRRFRIETQQSETGAMIVCKTNAQARKLYELWQSRYEEDNRLHSEFHRLKVLGTINYSTPDPHPVPLRASLILHDEGDKEERKAYIEEYKKLETVDVLIVNQMLLTGFDAPRLKKLYLGRKLDGHDLLQALTRVNRPYKDFQYGYVVDFVDIKENFDATNDRYLKELNRTIEDIGIVVPDDPAHCIIEDPETIKRDINEVRSVLFNFTCDNAEEFRMELDAIENKEVLYNLRNTLCKGKAILNRIRTAGDEDLHAKINAMGIGSFPTLIAEVTHRIDRINQINNTEYRADVSGIINLAMSELDFEFRKGIPEELRIAVNDLRDRYQAVQNEFEQNFDHKEDKYVILSEEFRKYFREHGFTPQNVAEIKASIAYMEQVMAKIREINRRNNLLKRKYKGDERFVRVHKRILEENEQRPDKPIITQEEYRLADSLAQMKQVIDQKVYLDINVLTNEAAFRRDVLAAVGKQLIGLEIQAPLEDRKYISNLIVGEYICNNVNYQVV